jgi:hypothetical protein
MKITQEQVDKIIDVMRNTFDVEVDDDETFRPEYSGRGMFGMSCIGFVIAPRAQLALGAAIAIALPGLHDNEDIDEDELDLMRELILSSRADTMAFDVIVYFPGIQLEDNNG